MPGTGKKTKIEANETDIGFLRKNLESKIERRRQKIPKAANEISEFTIYRSQKDLRLASTGSRNNVPKAPLSYKSIKYPFKYNKRKQYPEEHKQRFDLYQSEPEFEYNPTNDFHYGKSSTAAPLSIDSPLSSSKTVSISNHAIHIFSPNLNSIKIS